MPPTGGERHDAATPLHQATTGEKTEQEHGSGDELGSDRLAIVGIEKPRFGRALVS